LYVNEGKNCLHNFPSILTANKFMEMKCMFPTPLGAFGTSIHAPAALGHSAPPYWRLRRSSTGRLRHLYTGACGARPLGAFGAFILAPAALVHWATGRLWRLHTRARPLGDWATSARPTRACGARCLWRLDPRAFLAQPWPPFANPRFTTDRHRATNANN